MDELERLSPNPGVLERINRPFEPERLTPPLPGSFSFIESRTTASASKASGEASLRVALCLIRFFDAPAPYLVQSRSGI